MEKAFKGYKRADVADAEAHQFILILKDTTEFGNVGLAGIHHVLESDWDVSDIVDTAERDQFDRVFIYVRGYHDCTFDSGELRDLLNQLEDRGGTLTLNGRGSEAFDRWQSINKLLTMKQYHKVNTGDLGYRRLFERVLKVTERQSIVRLALDGLKYCHIYGW